MASKILIVGPSWVGDMVMAQTLFKILKARDPSIKIDVLAPGWSLPILARMPEVNTSIIMPIGHGQLKIRERYRIGKSLRKNNYIQAIVLPNSFKSALIPFFAKIPLRTGWKRELRSLILNDARALDKKRYPLMIEQYMALGVDRDQNLPSPHPLPQLKSLTDAQSQTIKKYNLTIEGKSILAICPGAEFGPAKRWPDTYYANIANQKLREGWEVWIFGSKKDEVVAEIIMQQTQNRCINFAGKTKLEEAVDLIALATAVVSNDSGLMHIAAGLNKPLIAVYGPTSPGFTPPLNEKAKVLTLKLDCQPCFQRECPLQHHRCMKELTPELISEELTLLEQ